MKKIFLTIMAFVYLAVASGATIHMHYCMDQLVSWNLSVDKTLDCPVCSTEKEGSTKNEISCKGCCKDDFKQVVIGKDQKAEQNFSLPIINEETASYTTIASYPFPTVQPIKSYNSNAPPPKHKVPDFIFNCIFRI